MAGPRKAVAEQRRAQEKPGTALLQRGDDAGEREADADGVQRSIELLGMGANVVGPVRFEIGIRHVPSSRRKAIDLPQPTTPADRVRGWLSSQNVTVT